MKIYKSAFHDNINDFLSRYTEKIDNYQCFDYQQAFSCCLEYLKEECAVMTLWTYGGYEFELYPHGRNKAMSATYEFLIKNLHPNLLKSVALRFKKYTANTQLTEASLA